MKVLTIRQPYATLILLRIKRYETRQWPTSYRGRIAIHAGSFPAEIPYRARNHPAINQTIHDNGYDLDNLPTRAIIGEVTILDCQPIEEVAHKLCWLEKQLGFWTPGNYAFELSDPLIYHDPIEVSGKPGFWEYHACSPTLY